MPTNNYVEAKTKFLESRVSITISGIPLDWDDDGKGFFPIWPCVCVTEPCPCDELDDIIVWLPTGTKGERTGNKINGSDVITYIVPGDTKLVIETEIPMTASGFKKFQHEVVETIRNPNSGLQILCKGKPLPPGSGAGFWLSAAAATGWAIGTFIDKEAGLSDKISDFLAEKIPWPW